MSAVELMTDLARLGIRIEAHGDRLRYAPQSAVTPHLLAGMKAHKAELLAMLGSEANEPVAHTNVHFSSKRDDWETPATGDACGAIRLPRAGERGNWL